jgi:ribose/xylose/arabinose/galactoside ABC-type transport system permease subunit
MSSARTTGEATVRRRVGAATAAATRRRDRRIALIDLVGRHGMAILFVVLVVAFAVTNADFRNPDNLRNILQQSSLIGIVSCGMLVVIIAGGFDLSVGAIGAGASVAAAALMGQESVLAGVLVALAIGIVVGLLNGLLITKIGITPFVATLGTSVLVTGFVFAPTNAKPISGVPLSFTNIGLGRLLGIPVPFVIFMATALVAWFILRRTRLGHYVYAVGSNREASRLSGVPVDTVLVFAFLLAGLCAGIAGVVMLGQTGIGQPSGAADWPLTAIAAVVVGGTPLRGGLGGIHSAIVGTLLLGVLANALNLYGVSPYWQPAVSGVVILLAVGIDSYQRKVRGDLE